MAAFPYEDSYKQTSLWRIFEEKANHNQANFVENLLAYAIPLLKKFSDTFPRYTDHGGRHQLNILNIISQLLGDRIAELSSLEAAILILSTYYHDLGMVYTAEERANISNEHDFHEFIKHNSNAELEYIENNSILTQQLEEWYCRWAHAKRVYVYLNKIERKQAGEDKLTLDWNGKISIRIKLGLVCESHNWSVDRLKNDDFDTAFLNEADLRFCAILLRLADVLDFDYSRAEESIYHYLNLNKANTSSEVYSKKEWGKHISSQGFTFPSDVRNIPYEIKFIAAPNKPETEISIRSFLDYIDSEIEQCRRLLQYCSDKWRNICLPDKISRSILSQGYQAGEFRFTLDQKQVLNLLMGEQIYDNQYVFVRELLQNALDTTRHKLFYEENNGQNNFTPKPIEVISWIDNNGYKWVRLDDFGMGMDENIIKKYLLRVGTSYYNSAEFKVEKFGYKKRSNKDFTPISRFGIGLLSCFMIGDRVEVSSWKRGSNPVRLSLTGLHDYYILQTGSDLPIEMPSEFKTDEGYRSEEGTSIAVRLDPNKENSSFKLEQLLEKWLFSSEVPVKYKGNIISDRSDLLSRPLIQHFEEYLDEDSVSRVSGFLGVELDGKIGIICYPIDITKASLSPYLKGQILLFKLILPENYKRSNGADVSITLTSRYPENHDRNGSAPGFSIEFRKDVKRNNEYVKETIRIQLPKLDELFEQISETYKFLNLKDFNFDKLLLIHNNIIIDFIGLNDFLISGSAYRRGMFATGFVSLYDEFRPNINVARDKVEQLSWQVWLHLDSALVQCVDIFDETYPGILDQKYWGHNLKETSVSNILNGLTDEDINILGNHIYFEVDEYITKLYELYSIIQNKVFPIKINFTNRASSFYLLAKAIIKQNYEVNFYIKENDSDETKLNHPVKESYFLILSDAKPYLSQADYRLPPFFFVKFQGSHKLYFQGYINSDHRLGNWLRNNFVFLMENYLGFLNDLIFEIRHIDYRHFSNKQGDINIFYSYKSEKINDVLTRLMRLPDISDDVRPTYEIFLKSDDFYLLQW